MTLRHYYNKIWTLLRQMHSAAEETLPANRVFIDLFLSAHPFWGLDGLLSGFQNASHGREKWTNWNKFLPYVQAEEKRLKVQLEVLQYNIDASDSLLLIMGLGRLERVSYSLLLHMCS